MWSAKNIFEATNIKNLRTYHFCGPLYRKFIKNEPSAQIYSSDPRPSKIVLGSEQFCILIFAEFSTFLLFSSTFPWVQMKNVYVFPDVCKDFWRKNVISWSFLNQNFYNVKQSLYLQLQCYMTIIFKNYDYNCCFNSEPFSWNKIQHKT